MATVEQVHLVLTLDDDGVVFMSFVTKGRMAQEAMANGFGSPDEHGYMTRELTESNLLAETFRYPWGGRVVSWRVIDFGDIPAAGEARAYRGAFRDTGTAIVHHMPTAREIHRDKLRRARAPHLESLDVAYLRAGEENDTLTQREIAAKKKALRDVTDDPAIEAATTVEELKTIWPLGLG